MKAESWKKIIDDLDDDIVDSAAERLSKPEHSTVDDMEAFTHDGKPTEYKYPSERKKHRGLYIGIGSAAAAAADALLFHQSPQQRFHRDRLPRHGAPDILHDLRQALR